jgi:hypothetical protein
VGVARRQLNEWQKRRPRKNLGASALSRLISRADCNYSPRSLISVDFPSPNIYQLSSHQSPAILDTQGSPRSVLGHVSGLMSSAHARRAFAPSSELDPVRQHKDRQRRMSDYFAGGLPYSRYVRLVNSISSYLMQIYCMEPDGQKTNWTLFLCQRVGVFDRRREMAGECRGW